MGGTMLMIMLDVDMGNILEQQLDLVWLTHDKINLLDDIELIGTKLTLTLLLDYRDWNLGQLWNLFSTFETLQQPTSQLETDCIWGIISSE